MLISEIINNWLSDVHSTKVNPNTHKTACAAVNKHLLPLLGKLEASESPQLILLNFNKIAPPKTRKILLNYLINAYDYAVFCEHIQYNNITHLRSYLKTSDYELRPFAALKKQEWPKFFKDIEKLQYTKVTKTLFWSLAYTALRRNEATAAMKSEFDFASGIWTIPAERMKNNSEHTVYLATSLQLMLIDLFNSNSSQYAFPSPKSKYDNHLDNWASYAVIRKAGYQKTQTIHGLRKIFSSHAHESKLFSTDAIELAIDHKIRGVRGVYNTARYEQERRQLAMWYGNEIDNWRIS